MWKGDGRRHRSRSKSNGGDCSRKEGNNGRVSVMKKCEEEENKGNGSSSMISYLLNRDMVE